MPIYTYQCKNCGQEVDKMIKRNKKDNPGLTCPNCGNNSFERKISVPGKIKSEASGNSGSSCPSGSCGI